MTQKQLLLASITIVSITATTAVIVKNEPTVDEKTPTEEWSEPKPVMDDVPILVDGKPIVIEPERHTMTWDEYQAYVLTIDKEIKANSGIYLQNKPLEQVIPEVERIAKQRPLEKKGQILDGIQYTPEEYKTLKENLFLKREINGKLKEEPK